MNFGAERQISSPLSQGGGWQSQPGGCSGLERSHHSVKSVIAATPARCAGSPLRRGHEKRRSRASAFIGVLCSGRLRRPGVWPPYGCGAAILPFCHRDNPRPLRGQPPAEGARDCAPQGRKFDRHGATPQLFIFQSPLTTVVPSYILTVLTDFIHLIHRREELV